MIHKSINLELVNSDSTGNRYNIMFSSSKNSNLIKLKPLSNVYYVSMYTSKNVRASSFGENEDGQRTPH